MSVALYERIMQEAKSAGVFQVALGGGNPNQHPNFCEILKLTREYGIVPSYTTNGQGMSEKIYAATKKYAGAVAVSWYYPYTDARIIIEKCNGLGIPVNIHFVLSEDSIEEAIKLLEDECIEYVNAVIFLAYKPVGAIHRKVLKKSKELSSLIERLLTFQKCQIGFDSCMISHLTEKKALVDPSSVDYCEAGRFSAFISEEGLVYPCSFMCGDGSEGYRIKENSLKDIWQKASEFVKIRNEMEQKRECCDSCSSYDMCHGGCPKFDINCI